MAYATAAQVAAGFRKMTEEEEAVCIALLEEAAVIIDAYNINALADIKKVVSCRMVRRAIGAGDASVPVGATQGTMTAGPYSQSWTMTSGSTGELYLGKTERSLLGAGHHIGASNPYEQAGLVEVVADD